MSTFGSTLSSHAGIFQARSSSRNIVAGMMVMRTMNASRSTARARAKPITLMNGSSMSMNAANTEIMINAAAVTTRAPCLKPLDVALPAVFPCAQPSRMRVTRKT